jgi:hypothetical protein
MRSRRCRNWRTQSTKSDFLYAHHIASVGDTLRR